jgi:NADH-quinone oxidoreductase subunit J
MPSWGRQSRLALLVLLLIAGAAIWIVSSFSMVFDAPTANLQLKQLSRELFTTYVLPFEAISILIVSAVIGALYIARKEEG